VVISQGEVWWADLDAPTGSAPGYPRPVVVVQSDQFNLSRISTVVCVPIVSNLRWSGAPGNVVLPAQASGLPKDSIAVASQVMTVDRAILTERVSRLSKANLNLVLAEIDVVLGR
jgi:mRNA interferase MazF